MDNSVLCYTNLSQNSDSFVTISMNFEDSLVFVAGILFPQSMPSRLGFKIMNLNTAVMKVVTEQNLCW